MRKIKFVKTEKTRSYAVLIPFSNKESAEKAYDEVRWAAEIVEVEEEINILGDKSK